MVDPADPGAAPDLTVVVVTWNTRDLLRSCLASLREAAGGMPYRMAVVVVDNASTDGTAAMVRAEFPDVYVVANDRNHGFAAGVNRGFRAIAGRHVLLLNSDATVTAAAIRRCVAYLDEHEDVAIVGCRLVFPDGTPQSSTFRFPSLRGVCLAAAWLSQLFPRSPFWNQDRYGHAIWREETTVDCVMGSFLLLRRALVPGPDLLDEGYFMYGEETDLCWHMASAGKRVVHLPDVHVVHHHGGSAREPSVEAWAYGAKRRGILRFLWLRRGTLRAYCANVVYLLALVPRAPGWLLLDLVDALRGRRGAGRRTRRLAIARFHLGALVRPGALASPWGGPP